MIPNKLIPMGLIDPPDIAMRSDMDDAQLDALAKDIAKNGLIHPIAVKAVAGRYKIAAGHRRYVAHQILGREEIESKDYTHSGLSDKAIMFSENKRREDVNPADEADWLMDIQEDGKLTLEALTEITGESEDWISKRLSLFRGDQAVFNALRGKEINFGHALELNKFPDNIRQQYLEYCINSTPPIATVQQWRRDAKLMNLGEQVPQPANGVQGQAPVLPGVVVDACELCNSNTAPWDFAFVKVHKQCLSNIQKAIKDQLEGGS